MSNGPNLFKYATSELSQDAFFCWLIEWANENYREIEEPLHRTGVAFLKHLLGLKGLTPPEPYQVKVHRQVENIDILAVVNNEIAVVIEDKVHTKEHSGQLPRYVERVLKRAFPKEKIAAIYLKTGDQSDYSEVEKAEYVSCGREDILRILRSGKRDGVRSDIYLDFLRHLEWIEEGVGAYRTTPLDPLIPWDGYCWIGFFKELQQRLSVDGKKGWQHVPNKAKGFWGFHWHWRQNPSLAMEQSNLFLQLEECKLCFKLYCPQSENQKEQLEIWRRRLWEEAQRSGLPLKLSHRKVGTWMTLARLDKKDYRMPGENGRIDVEKTISFLHTAEEVLDRAVNQNPSGT